MTIQLKKPVEVANEVSLPRPLPPVRIETGSPGAWLDLRSGLEDLGFEVCVAGESSPEGEVILVADGGFPAADGNTPFLIVARERSLLAAQSAVTSGASGYFAAPFDFIALGVAIRAAATQARELAALTGRIAKLRESIESDQLVSTVVGILMERFRLQRAEAYARLRQYSRAERRKIVELATDLVGTTEELGRTMRAINVRAED